MWTIEFHDFEPEFLAGGGKGSVADGRKAPRRLWSADGEWRTAFAFDPRGGRTAQREAKRSW